MSLFITKSVDALASSAEGARRQRDFGVASPQAVVRLESERTEPNLQKFRLSSGNLQDVLTARAQL